MRNEFINQKMELKKNFPNRKRGKKYAKKVLGNTDFRDGNANIWIRSYQKKKELKREKRKHFIK